MFDTHQSGSIDAKDIETMLCGFGISLEKEELDARLSMMASRKCITFPEFLTLLSPSINADRTAEAHEVFAIMDSDGSGGISNVELRHIMQNLGECIPDEEVDAMLAAADDDGGGTIEIDEFVEFLCSLD